MGIGKPSMLDVKQKMQDLKIIHAVFLRVYETQHKYAEAAMKQAYDVLLAEASNGCVSRIVLLNYDNAIQKMRTAKVLCTLISREIAKEQMRITQIDQRMMCNLERFDYSQAMDELNIMRVNFAEEFQL